MAIIAKRTKKLITLIPLRRRYPKQIGEEVEANVPTADTIPAPIPLARAGYNSQKQTWKKQKKKETHPLKMKTTMISMMLCMHRSHSSGFTTKVSTKAHAPATTNSIIPSDLRGIFYMRKKEGIKVTSYERLTRQLLTNMSKPMSSMIRAGPQYMAQVMKEMKLQVIVVIRKLGKRHKSMGVIYWSLKSYAI